MATVLESIAKHAEVHAQARALLAERVTALTDAKALLHREHLPGVKRALNRAAETDRLMANHDYAVNLKAEIEIMALHEKFDAMRTDELHAQLQRQQVLIEELLALQRKA